MAKSNVLGIDWQMSDIWNATLDSEQDRPLMPRNYIWASELGQSFIDRYLRMSAVPYTNPPNKRSRRKFTAGKVWEWTLGMVFIAAGILKKTQTRVEHELPGMLRVSGKLDFIVGGKFDYDTAKKKIEEMRSLLVLFDLEVPPFFFNAADNFIDKYKGQILMDKVYEAKTVSSFMMERVQKIGAMKHHILQDYHYVKYNDIGIKAGVVGYLCKDDCVMKEEPVYDNAQNSKLYKSDISQMTDYYNVGFDRTNPLRLAPPKEPELMFDTDLFRFTKNFKVEYSPYLTMIYGFEKPKDYSSKWSPLVSSWNRVFKRCVMGDKMTDKNLAVISEAKAGVLPNWDKMVTLAKQSGVFNNDDDEE